MLALVRINLFAGAGVFIERNSDMRILRLPDNFLSALRAEGQTGKNDSESSSVSAKPLETKHLLFTPKS